jgi:lysophospholipid acyltransferase (LPLAT)-like uncharacterized protein
MSQVADRAFEAIVPRVGYAYIRLLRLTMRVEYRNREVLDRAGQYILIFWHSRFVMMPYCYPGDRMVVLNSQHRDSRMLVKILERFGIEGVWGSSTSGGARGLRELLRRVKQGYDVGITPDGPRGPRRRLKSGVVATARLSGLPIIPVTFSARPAKRLRSWDRTLLPLPFARGLFVYGEPVTIPRDADETASEQARSALEREMDRLTDLADGEVGTQVEPPRPPGEA